MAEKKKKYFPIKNLQAQLEQLTEITHANDLISPKDADILLSRGLISCSFGFYIITPDGIALLAQLDIIHPSKR